MTTIVRRSERARPSWISRFWAVVKYEMLWNIRKKKFIGILIISFALATLGLALPVILSNATGQSISANPDYAISATVDSFAFFLFALATAMNSISSEFESGTIVPLLTKPVSRTMVFLGKLFAAFLIILLSYVILFTYTVIGGVIVYGPQNNLHLVTLALLGNVISTFIWVAIIFAVGALSKNTIVAALVALGLFLSLYIALPIVSVFSGSSPSLNYVPGSGALGTLNVAAGQNITIQNVTINTFTSISTGTDDIGINLVKYTLYPSASVNFTRTSVLLTDPMVVPELLYTEPMAFIALRSIAVAFLYIFVFLFIGWYAFKRAQILE
jgi:ABC-type transport system involved in multi-copper enzyme maturation permease subunit